MAHTVEITKSNGKKLVMEIKPCPFDGCKDVYCEEIDGLWGVICTKCDCVGPIHETKEQAIDAWNKRS